MDNSIKNLMDQNIFDDNPNRFEKVLLAVKRAEEMMRGAPTFLNNQNTNDTKCFLAVKEINEEALDLCKLRSLLIEDNCKSIVLKDIKNKTSIGNEGKLKNVNSKNIDELIQMFQPSNDESEDDEGIIYHSNKNNVDEFVDLSKNEDDSLLEENEEEELEDEIDDIKFEEEDSDEDDDFNEEEEDFDQEIFGKKNQLMDKKNKKKD